MSVSAVADHAAARMLPHDCCYDDTALRVLIRSAETEGFAAANMYAAQALSCKIKNCYSYSVRNSCSAGAVSEDRKLLLLLSMQR